LKREKHTTGGIPRWSPTLVLVARFSAYVWQSGRDAQFSLTYGRMYSGQHILQNIRCNMWWLKLQLVGNPRQLGSQACQFPQPKWHLTALLRCSQSITNQEREFVDKNRSLLMTRPSLACMRCKQCDAKWEEADHVNTHTTAIATTGRTWLARLFRSQQQTTRNLDQLPETPNIR
jgi:hypothetical protein